MGGTRESAVPSDGHRPAGVRARRASFTGRPQLLDDLLRDPEQWGTRRPFGGHVTGLRVGAGGLAFLPSTLVYPEGFVIHPGGMTSPRSLLCTSS